MLGLTFGAKDFGINFRIFYFFAPFRQKTNFGCWNLIVLLAMPFEGRGGKFLSQTTNRLKQANYGHTILIME